MEFYSQNDKRKIGGFGQLPENVDATGRIIREDRNQPPVPKKKPVQTAAERKEAILKNKNMSFHVASNPDADGSKPLHALDFFSEVKTNEKTIEREAKKAGVDPNLVKAIVHLETTHGHYDRPAEDLNINKSIRPMNIRAEYWKDLGYSRKDLNNDEKNIQAGVELLKRIQHKMPGADTAKIASVYKRLGTTKVSNYGARIEKLIKEKPWEK